MKVTEKEVESVSSLEPFKRYQYFIKRVADSEKLYSLQNKEGNWAISELEGQSLFPFWSAKEFAENCTMDGWEGYSVKEVPMDDFEEELISLIEYNDYLLNIFPVAEKTGFVVNLDEFVRDLTEEMGKYE